MDISMDGTIAQAHRRRLLFLSAVLVTNLSSIYLLAGIVHRSAPNWLGLLIVILFVILFFWISFYFWTAIIGFIVRMADRDRAAISRTAAEFVPPFLARTAIIMPIRNENTARVFAGLQAIFESILETGRQDSFDFFVLSDTDDPQIRSEEKTWAGVLRLKAPDKLRFFYRNRQYNDNRKVGNIRDFCLTWGRHYKYMIVLDADSIMTGEAILKLVMIMERNPRTALVQTAPYPVNQYSLFARIQQFASRLYGPILMAGLNFWQSAEGNYWGHNAIIRIEPYVRHCELPSIPGKGPFGGELWSHDFVEAALLRAAGWGVWLAYDLEGSYEEMPPNLIAYAQRDQRWCRGNLQHTRLLGMRGLHLISRFHLFAGIMSYVCAPLLLTLIIAVGTDIYLHRPEGLFIMTGAFFTGDAATLILCTLTAVMFLLPRLLALVWFHSRPERLKPFGGTAKACVSVVLETLCSIMISPIMMMVKTRSILTGLFGKKRTWEKRCEGRRIRLAEAASFHAGQTMLGLASGIVLLSDVKNFFWWYTPALLWLLLSVPVSIFFSETEIGKKAGRAGLFIIPEESDPPPILTKLQTNSIRNAFRAIPIAAKRRSAHQTSGIRSQTSGIGL